MNCIQLLLLLLRQLDADESGRVGGKSVRNLLAMRRQILPPKLTLSIGDLQEGEEEQGEEEDGEGEEKSDRTMATATITKSKQSGPPSKPRRACVSWLV